MKERALLSAILIYLTMDLSVAAMPGAFVFEVADSVESVQMSRGRGAADVSALPAPRRESFTLSRPRIEMPRRLASPTSRAHRLDSVANWLPRSLPDSAPPSEDPH